jgi:dienelactone hydrolase
MGKSVKYRGFDLRALSLMILSVLSFLWIILSVLGSEAAAAPMSGPDLVRGAGWQWKIIKAGAFDVATAQRPDTIASDVLTVYIEGDGLAYVTPGRRAMDPTPTDPLALRLALEHPGKGAVAWLARPCQYGPRTRNCQSDYWSIARYSPEVIDSTSAALDQLKADRNGTERLILVGYSGGGALAALLAERRHDVAALVTVAANLDLGSWVRSRGLTPLSRSLDPAKDAAKLSRLPQVHFVGANDRVVDEPIARAFVAHMPPDAPVTIAVISGQDHGCCWAKQWPDLATTPEMMHLEGWP